jgi:hypothetical protein
VVSFGPDQPDWCLLHGHDHMRREAGNPISVCDACDADFDPLEKLAGWMNANGFATGHGDTFDNLLRELDWQIKELRARNR